MGDAVLTIDDVIVGEVEPKPKSTKRLIREKLAGGEESSDKLAPIQKGSGNWEGLPTNELDLDIRVDKITRTPSLRTVKTTHAHLAAIKARNTAYEDYKSRFIESLSSIKMSKEEQLDKEGH